MSDDERLTPNQIAAMREAGLQNAADAAWLSVENETLRDQLAGAVSLTDDQRRVVVPILTGALERWPLTDAERRTLREAINALDNPGGQ
jgi:predicted DNA binding protein